MSAYLINVLMSFIPYFVFGLLLVGLVSITLALLSVWPLNTDYTKLIRRGTAIAVCIVWALGLVVALISPVNTYKHAPHDRVELNRQIEKQQTAPAAAEPITDRTRQPNMTDSERQERFDRLTTYPRTE